MPVNVPSVRLYIIGRGQTLWADASIDALGSQVLARLLRDTTWSNTVSLQWLM